MVLFIRFDAVMQRQTVITPEGTTLEAVRTFSAFSVAIATLDAACIALFDGQHIQQTIDSKVCRQSVKTTASRDSEVLPTLWARNGFSNSDGLLNPLQTVKAKAVQARQLLWICELCHTHRAGYFFMKIVQEVLDIHN